MLRAAFTSALHGPAVQDWHSKTAWLLRFPGATCPHAEHRCDVCAAGICSTRPQALCCSRAAIKPHPLRLMPRLSPRFCATRTPGCSIVPRAERVIARTSRASMRIVSKRRADEVSRRSNAASRIAAVPCSETGVDQHQPVGGFDQQHVTHHLAAPERIQGSAVEMVNLHRCSSTRACRRAPPLVGVCAAVRRSPSRTPRRTRNW